MSENDRNLARVVESTPYRCESRLRNIGPSIQPMGFSIQSTGPGIMPMAKRVAEMEPNIVTDLRKAVRLDDVCLVLRLNLSFVSHLKY